MWIGLGTLLAGMPLMYFWNARDHAFFRVRPDPDRSSTATRGRRIRSRPSSRRTRRADGRRGRSSATTARRVRWRRCRPPPRSRPLRASARDRVRLPARADRRRGRRPRPGGPRRRRADRRRGRGGGARRRTRRSTSRWSWSTTVLPTRCCGRPTSTTRWRSSSVRPGGGRSPVSLLGSVTYQVVHRSTRPVVVVPAPAD